MSYKSTNAKRKTPTITSSSQRSRLGPLVISPPQRFCIAILVALPQLACADAVETTLVSFDGTNGHYPTQGLLLASDGNFYGTTPSYGADNGTVFRITPTGTLTTIYRFTGLADEGNPLAALIQGSDGNLYGTTAGGLPLNTARFSSSRSMEP